MRFTVTALGATGGRTVAAVVADIVRYLKERPDQSHEVTPPPGADGRPDGAGTDLNRGEPSRYYADEGERSGRWLGQGASGLGLHGDVDAQDFRRVLGGRHPRTSERLISARGSAGRVAELGAGTVAGYAAGRRSPLRGRRCRHGPRLVPGRCGRRGRRGAPARGRADLRGPRRHRDRSRRRDGNGRDRHGPGPVRRPGRDRVRPGLGTGTGGSPGQRVPFRRTGRRDERSRRDPERRRGGPPHRHVEVLRGAPLPDLGGAPGRHRGGRRGRDTVPARLHRGHP